MEPMRRGQVTRFQLEGQSHVERAAEIHCSLTIEKNPSIPGSFEIRPETANWMVEPSRRFCFTLEVVTAPSVPLHLYRAVAFAYFDGKLCSAQTMVRVIGG
jgi:hypothetical protein